MDVGVHWIARDPQSEWQLALGMACVAGVGTSVFLLVDLFGAGVRPGELIVRIIHLLILAGVGAWLSTRRHRPTRRLCTIAVVMMWAPYFVSLWLSEVTAASTEHPWAPFVGHKMLFIGTAVMIPGSPWFGGAMIAALALHALVLWFHLDLSAASANLPLDEPWATFGYLCVAGALYGFRVYHGRIERELARVRAEARTLEVSTEVLFGLHDLMNTPLQVLELAIALLRRRQEVDDPVIDAAIHALARLHVLRDQLPVLPVLPVSTVTHASLDPEVLRRLQAAVASSEAMRQSGD